MKSKFRSSNSIHLQLVIYWCLRRQLCDDELLFVRNVLFCTCKRSLFLTSLRYLTHVSGNWVCANGEQGCRRVRSFCSSCSDIMFQWLEFFQYLQASQLWAKMSRQKKRKKTNKQHIKQLITETFNWRLQHMGEGVFEYNARRLYVLPYIASYRHTASWDEQLMIYCSLSLSSNWMTPWHFKRKQCQLFQP